MIMKSRGIKILVLIGILLTSLSSFAGRGTKSSIEDKATAQMQKINKVCNLTTIQQAQIQKIFVSSFSKRQEVVSKNGIQKKSMNSVADKKARRGEKSTMLKENRRNTDEEIRSILTSAQITKWKSYQESQKNLKPKLQTKAQTKAPTNAVKK